MIDRDDPVDGLVPVDDPRVTAFRRWLRAADEWCLTRAERNDREAAWDEAGTLIGSFRELVIETPFPDVMRDRMAMEWEATAVNPEWPHDVADQRRTLVALKRAMVDFGPAFLGPHYVLLAGDLAMRAEGSPPLIDAKIPPANRYGYNPLLMDAAKSQTIRLAHYNAGLEGSNWRAEHVKIYPRLGDDMRKVWNALVSEPERRDCWRVGKLVRGKAPLTLEDAVIQLQATRYEAAILREWIDGNPD
jgi:hypothetical protein